MAYANEPAYLYNVPIWLFCNVYNVADNDVTTAGQARATMRRFHWLQVNAICIISDSAWSAARVLQDLYKSFILVFLQLCGALKIWKALWLDSVVFADHRNKKRRKRSTHLFWLVAVVSDHTWPQKDYQAFHISKLQCLVSSHFMGTTTVLM